MAIYTVQCLYPLYYSNVVTVEADTPDAACQLAIAQANDDADGWDALDQPGSTFIERVAMGEHDCPWDAPKTAVIAVPETFGELAMLGGVPAHPKPTITTSSENEETTGP